MKSIELLNKYPLSTKVIKDWYMEEMLKSLKVNDIPEDFKQSVLKEGVSDERLAEVITIQPRGLFDVFDENNLVISIFINNSKFGYRINNLIGFTEEFSTRKETELQSIQDCFKFLEEKLTFIELPKLEE